MAPVLLSPGVSVDIIDESFYNSAAEGTIPLFIIGTGSNKSSPTAGAGLAPMTIPKQAGKLFLATSQRDLIQNYGNPFFYAPQGTPLHGYELNEYGLWAAYSYLGIANQAYILRADLDFSQLFPSALAPVGPPLAGTLWLNLGATSWGVFRANGSTSPGAAWNLVTVTVALDANIDIDDVPLTGFGNNGDIAVVPVTASNYFYEKTGGVWHIIGGAPWKADHPTIVRGSAVAATLVHNDTFVINSTTVTVTTAPYNIPQIVIDINAASIPHITASQAVNNSLVLTNTIGGSVVIATGTGTPLTALGITARTYNGVSVTRNTGPTYPDGSVAGSLWVKGNPANHGASWSINFYNGTLGQFTPVTAPFYVFDSTLLDGNLSKDAAALAAIRNPASGTLYIGFDITTGDQQLRRWSGSQWQSPQYEAEFNPPSTPPVDGTLWYNVNFAADIMYGDGVLWHGYCHQYPFTNPEGPQLSGSAPLFQSDGMTTLVDNDLWIDTSNLEDYPAIYRWSVLDMKWQAIDKTDHTTPFGIIFSDARTNSGTTFTNIGNGGSYTFLSTLPSDMALSDYVDPDAPDPRTHPAGMLLFNTRYSTYNVKRWTPNYFKPGLPPFHADPNEDFTTTQYNVGEPADLSVGFEFPLLASAGTWVTDSGNDTTTLAPFMGRKAQRVEVVRAMAGLVNSNQDIRSELVFFNLMAAPGYPELMLEFINLNADMKETSFCVLDTPIRLISEGTAIQNWANNGLDVASDGEDGLVNADHNTAVYYPWGLSTNLDGTEIMIPPSAIALRTMAYNDQVAYPWYAPAGFNRGLVTNATSVGYLSSQGEYVPTILNNGQRDVLYTNKVNPIAYIPHRGLTVFGQKTLSAVTSALDRINVARLINYIAYHLDVILKPYLFEQNITNTRTSAKHTVERFFNGLVGLNGLYDYSVVCDLSNNTPERIDKNELWIDAAIQPVKAIEFIYVPVRILTTQATTGF
jgi:hypothetical protein